MSTRPMHSKGAVEIDTNEHIYAHPDYVEKLYDHRTFGAQTLHEVIEHAVQSRGDQPLFSYRDSSDKPFESYTYKQVFDMIHDIGSAMVQIGLKKSNDTFIGIYGSATVQYALFLFSSWSFSLVPVGIYDTLGKDGVRFIMKHAELQLIFADDLERVKNLVEWHSEESALKTIISLLEPSLELIQAAKSKNLQIITFEKMMEMGRAHPTEPAPPKPSDIAVVMYTSGSTGEPKGCVITHEAFMCASIGIMLVIDLEELAREEVPRVLNFMPLAHMFGCGTLVAATCLGGEIGFWQGKVDKLMDDFRDFKPNIILMVPRLLNKLYDTVMSEARRKGLSAIDNLKSAIQSKLTEIRQGNSSQDTIWDDHIFHQIRLMFGNKVKRVISSSAPLSSEVADFCRAMFSCMFIEGYGQTECTAGCWQAMNDTKSGETGIPTPVNHIKLIDVPEKGYFAQDRVGEICIRSKALFKGYLKDEIKTSETIDEEGWLHTGDVGRWTENNTMHIIDRQKNIYKLSQGEYIAPEKIEGIYARSQFISQVFVYGDSFQNFPVAIVVLDDGFVKKWAAENSIDATLLDTPEIDDRLRQAVLKDMIENGEQRNLMSFEQVKAIEMIKEPFTIENGLLTPTFKARRYAVEKQYKPIFDKLYKTMND